MMQTLKYGGFLRDDGLFQLGVMKKFCKIIKQKPSMTLKIQPITKFASEYREEFSHWPVTLLRGIEDKVEFFTSMAIKGVTEVQGNVILKLRNRLWLKLVLFFCGFFIRFCDHQFQPYKATKVNACSTKNNLAK